MTWRPQGSCARFSSARLTRMPASSPSTRPAPRRCRALAHERVRYVGEAVVLVVAETLQQARDAAEAVGVEYEELPHVVDLEAATSPGAVVLCEAAPDNVAAEMRFGDA